MKLKLISIPTREVKDRSIIDQLRTADFQTFFEAAFDAAKSPGLLPVIIDQYLRFELREEKDPWGLFCQFSLIPILITFSDKQLNEYFPKNREAQRSEFMRQIQLQRNNDQDTYDFNPFALEEEINWKDTKLISGIMRFLGWAPLTRMKWMVMLHNGKDAGVYWGGLVYRGRVITRLVDLLKIDLSNQFTQGHHQNLAEGFVRDFKYHEFFSEFYPQGRPTVLDIQNEDYLSMRLSEGQKAIVPIKSAELDGFLRFYFPKGALFGAEKNWNDDEAIQNERPDIHEGLDFGYYITRAGIRENIKIGTPIRAPFDGIMEGYTGNGIIIRHSAIYAPEILLGVYCHLESIGLRLDMLNRGKLSG